MSIEEDHLPTGSLPGAGEAPQFTSTAVLEGRERHDHRGDRPPRRPAAPRPHHPGLMTAITVPVRPGLAAGYLPEGGK